MTRTYIAAALAGLIALPALAFDGKGTMIDDARMVEITTLLSAQGYEVHEIEAEDGMIEVEARKDGQDYELYLDAALQVIRTKVDD